jgi:hypothetical protein
MYLFLVDVVGEITDGLIVNSIGIGSIARWCLGLAITISLPLPLIIIIAPNLRRCN